MNQPQLLTDPLGLQSVPNVAGHFSFSGGLPGSIPPNNPGVGTVPKRKLLPNENIIGNYGKAWSILMSSHVGLPVQALIRSTPVAWGMLRGGVLASNNFATKALCDVVPVRGHLLYMRHSEDLLDSLSAITIKGPPNMTFFMVL
jgi:hypothetical protein